MAANMNSGWAKIPCKINQLRLDIVLASGQSFRWRKTGDNEWTGVLKGKVWTLKQDDHCVYYQVYEREGSSENSKLRQTSKKGPATHEKIMDENDSILHDYFQLDVDILQLYSKWCNLDPNFCRIAMLFPGVRALRQDPVENVFSFICSSNNNIPRITGMVEKLCVIYGDKVGEVDGVVYHSFPSVCSLSGSTVEQQLREQGFGYRAKFIHQSAKVIQEKGLDWLYGLRNVSYEQAHQALLELPGVGAKVADCVCLMSLDKTNAIPVDTHVWQITTKHYMQNLPKTKSLTNKLYKQIVEYYQQLFGDYAGWAQCVLFSADLKIFQNLQPGSHIKSESQKRPLPNQPEPEVKQEKKTKKKRCS